MVFSYSTARQPAEPRAAVGGEPLALGRDEVVVQRFRDRGHVFGRRRGGFFLGGISPAAMRSWTFTQRAKFSGSAGSNFERGEVEAARF